MHSSSLIMMAVVLWLLYKIYKYIFMNMERNALFYIVVAMLFTPAFALLIYFLDRNNRR